MKTQNKKIETLYSVSDSGTHHLTSNKDEATIFRRMAAEHQGKSYSNFTLEEKEDGYIVIVKAERFF
tara:strand:+ start:307 stop:507 length:201 start_codon:yes stop_codon:yes gene_type:complete